MKISHLRKKFNLMLIVHVKKKLKNSFTVHKQMLVFKIDLMLITFN